MKSNKTFLILVVFLAFVPLYAQNPIVPPGVYIADPSAHVWKDGKLYIYGSLDESPDYYCSWRHHVLATSRIDAERACSMLGHVRIQLFEPGNEELGQIKHEDRAVFKYIDFSAGVNSVSARVKPGTTAGTISLKQDMPWGPTITNVTVPAQSEGDGWITIEADVNEVAGVHALWLMFYSDNRDYDLDLAVDWLKFL